jgi:hypothetical protein
MIEYIQTLPLPLISYDASMYINASVCRGDRGSLGHGRVPGSQG